jgi:peptide/nickel transport system permease protein
MVGAAFGRTMALLALTLVIVVLFSIPLGCISAATRGSALDLGVRVGTYVAWAVPAFVIAIILQQGLGRLPLGWGLGWFPGVGWAGTCPGGEGVDISTGMCPAAGHGLTHVVQVIYHLTLPAIALALGFIAINARYLRGSLLDTLDAPFITVARGKGLSERAVLLRHGLRNAFVAFVPALVSNIGLIFGGALVVDYVFKLGGIGTLFLALLPYSQDGLVLVDTYALMLLFVFAAAVMIVASTLGEAVVALLDPRVRLE